jgi:polysaccharide biosynthesis/export protein
MAAKSPDVALENEDVLFIPNSAAKSAARRSMESIVQVATGLAIYRR